MASYDVIIVGAGPAGLFAALEVAERSEGSVRIAILERGRRVEERRCPLTATFKGRECKMCSPCHILHGVGGAGALSSGTVNLRPDIGGDLDKLLGSWEEAMKLIEYVDKRLVEFGAPQDRVYSPKPEAARELERLSAKAGAKFIPVKQRHIGTDNTVKVISNIVRRLESLGVKVYSSTPAEKVEVREGSFKITTGKGEVLESEYLLLAPGRSGADWLSKQAKTIGLKVSPGPLDVGVRVEVPAYVMEPITNLVLDPKIIMYTRAYDDKVRTFCTNPNGFVVEELYEDGTVGVNGETYENIKSQNTNFALLVTVRLTNPMEDTIEYGKNVARMATKLGGGKPLIQRLGDLEAGRRSTWARIDRSTIEPTLKNASPGDIGMALPYRVLEDLLEAIRRLDTIAPGIASPQSLLYAPEIKYYSLRVETSNNLETNIENLYVAGDGAGLSRGINVAAATGIIAGRSILEKMGFYDPTL